MERFILISYLLEMSTFNIQVTPQNNTLLVIDNDQNQVVVTNPITSIVEVTALGPQGQKGDQGFSIFTLVSGSTYATTSSLVISGSFLVSGSSTFTNIGPAIFSGSVTTNQGFTGSLFGTSSYALTASYALNVPTTASYAIQALSSSYAISSSYAVSASYAQTASYVLNAVSSSNASTASYVVLSQTASYIQNAQSASYVLNAISSSFSTTASYASTTSYALNVPATASYALQALSSSYSQTSSFVVLAQTASYVLNSVSSSFSTTASYIQNAQTASFVQNAISSSFAATASFITLAQSASYVLNTVSSSFSTTASYASTASYALNVPATASYALQAISSSYALTASYALNGGSGGGGGGSYIITESVTASVNTGTNSFTVISGSTNLLTLGNTGGLNISSLTASSAIITSSIELPAGATNPRIANIAYTINNTGAQTGTLSGIFLNATETNLNGQTHNLMDLQVGGVSQIKVNRVGALSVATSFGFTAKSLITSPSDGIIQLSNNAGTDFSRLQLGGTSSAYPAIYRNGTGIDFKLADNSAYCPVITGQLTAQDTIQVNTPTGGNTGNIKIFGGSLAGQTVDITKFSISTYFTPSGVNGNTYTGYGFYSTINQTGGANGATRAIYVNPTLTSAPDFRAFESTAGGAYFNTTSVQASAILQADSITKGFLPPRMTTTQRDAISSPAAGLVVYDNTTNAVAYRDATNWGYLSGASQSISGAGGTVNIPFSSGNIVNLTLTASTTLTFSSASLGVYILKVIQGGSGSYTLTYPASVKWSGGTAPTLTTTVSKTDIITLFYDGTTYFGTYSLNY